jgi:alkylation response protein AidB-like acyl-CoA dehydrogenase
MSEQTLAEFLDQATRFLDSAAGRAPAATSRPWGEGPDGTELLAEWSSEEEARLVTEARRFKALEYDAGFGWIDGPAAYGGRGLPRSYHEAYARLREQFAVPDLAVMRLGLSMTAPTILAHGTEQVKRAYLPRLHRGDVIACQLFSEPDAGSDLASLRASAVPDGDGWVLRGQKVWTTNAHLSDIGEVLCRTDPRAPKHRGITAFLIDMHAPGVEVRPLTQITGEAEFNEIFFSDVEVPVENRLGEEGDGWQVAMTTLLHERATLGFALTATLDALFGRLLHETDGQDPEPHVREALAREWIELQALRFTNYRALGTYERTGVPGPEGSGVKLRWSEANQRLTKLARELRGADGILDDGWWNHQQLRSRGNTIEAGTSEVLRNIIAERVLGLPRSR